jgi:hypothetical protein
MIAMDCLSRVCLRGPGFGFFNYFSVIIIEPTAVQASLPAASPPAAAAPPRHLRLPAPSASASFMRLSSSSSPTSVQPHPPLPLPPSTFPSFQFNCKALQGRTSHHCPHLQPCPLGTHQVISLVASETLTKKNQRRSLQEHWAEMRVQQQAGRSKCAFAEPQSDPIILFLFRAFDSHSFFSGSPQVLLGSQSLDRQMACLTALAVLSLVSTAVTGKETSAS